MHIVNLSAYNVLRIAQCAAKLPPDRKLPPAASIATLPNIVPRYSMGIGFAEGRTCRFRIIIGRLITYVSQISSSVLHLELTW
jgi:hypothetical protein